MANTIDAKKALTRLAEIWADQYGQKIVDIKITRRGSNEESNSAVNSDNSI